MARRSWRQELETARQAQRDYCGACDRGGLRAVAVDVYTYAIGRSVTSTQGYAAKLDTERRIRLGVCPRHLRALKRGRPLIAGARAVTLVPRGPARLPG